MTSGNIGKWKKKVGDKISPGDVLVELETDKATIDFEYQEEGFLAKVFAETGTKDVPINQTICLIVENQADISVVSSFSVASTQGSSNPPVASIEPASAPSVSKPAPQAASAVQSAAPTAATPSSGRILVSPVARKIAGERSIPLEQVKGTGPSGRITKADVLDFQPSGNRDYIFLILKGD